VTAGTSSPRPPLATAATLTEAATLINAGRNREAAALLLRMADGNPTPNPRADYLLGVAAFRSGDLVTAVDAFRRCVAADPRSGPAHHGLGTALRALGDHEGARLALAAAERADPHLAARAAVAGAAGRSLLPPPTAAANADLTAKSLADILDRDVTEPPRTESLAGRILWRGRPAVRAVIVPTIAPLLLLVVPVAISRFAEALPAGVPRQAATQLGRDSLAATLLLAAVLCAASVINWLMRELVVRERRIDLWTGLLAHRHVVIWLHDIERPLVIKQPLWQLALNLGTLHITSTILPAAHRRQAATRLGHLRFSGLPIREAEGVAELVWSRSLWERRRMVKNFVSTR
jgi:tetratricopeptide (TPR) repeat protein